MANKYSIPTANCNINFRDINTINTLFDQYWLPLFQFSYNLLKNDDDAKDAVQEVFINLWDRESSIQINTSIESYLFTSVKYKSLSKLTKRLAEGSRNLPFESYLEHSFLQATDPLDLKELQQEIDAQINKLPARMQQVLLLKSKECLSNAEIACRLNISEETVKNHLAAGRKKLRLSLGDLAYGFILLSLF